MKIDFKKLITFIAIPLVLGAIVGFLTRGEYKDMVMPSFAPPGILFPIVWSILYILMGISRYLIDDKEENEEAIKVYNFQLIVNLLWSFVFFTFKWYLFAFIWILLLIVLVIVMIKRFYSLSKLSGLLQIPYLLWILFAAILNFAVYTLN